MKKFFTFGAIFVGIILFAFLGAYLVVTLQRTQDYKTLQTFVAGTAELKAVWDETPIKGPSACIPAKKAGRCPTLFYKISDQSCKTLMESYGINKDNCAATKKVTYNGRKIEIHFGQSYEHTDSNLQITMDEPNLLWQLY